MSILVRRSIWLPNWKLTLMITVGCTLAAALVLRSAYDFLAPKRPLASPDVLIVEGWVTDRTLAEAKRHWELTEADRICTVGVDINRGRRLVTWKDWATVGGETLKRMGVPANDILIAAGGAQQNHRTYTSFLAARDLLKATLPEVPKKILLVSEAHHGRRSALVAQKVFGPETEIGVLSIEPEAYDHRRWWSSSDGAKNVLMEAMAFLYERLADGGR